jgi:hypothetical protein
VALRRVGDRGRTATVAVRAGPVTIKRPRHGFAKTGPETVSMTLVEVREINPPANEESLHWRLLTSIAVSGADAACEIVRLYRLRWRIEEVFRALKSDGMRLEETQMHEAERLFKRAVAGLAAACRTIQLVDARDGSPRPATDVIDPALLPAAEAIGPALEGKTEGSYRVICWPLQTKLNAQGHAREGLRCWGANSLRTCHRDRSGAGYRFSAVESEVINRTRSFTEFARSFTEFHGARSWSHFCVRSKLDAFARARRGEFNARGGDPLDFPNSVRLRANPVILRVRLITLQRTARSNQHGPPT